MDRKFSVTIGDPLSNISTFDLLARTLPRGIEVSEPISLVDNGCDGEKRRISITIQNCPDDITAFEVCEWVRKALDSKYSVSVAEEKGEN